MDFQGFQHIFPPAVLLIICVALIALSWFAYRKQGSLPPVISWVLTAIRSIALIIIFLLLLNPYFYSSREVERNPKVAVFLDNSESIGITKGNYQGLQTYNELLNTLNFELYENADFEYYSIGEEVFPFHPDSINASHTQTNLSDPIQSVLEMNDQVKAAIIISDGILTYGRNPTVSAFETSIPLYTIGIGDTSLVEDIAVSNVVTNSTGYTNTSHRVEADISQSGFSGSSVTVTLQSEGEILADQTLDFDTDDQIKRIRFDHEFDKAGLRQFQISVNPLLDEFTEINNTRVFSIDVLDSKVRILHVAFEIHPDVKAVRSVIQNDINNELTPLTYLGNNRFIEEIPTDEDFNLIVIHGQPERNTDLSLQTMYEAIPTVHFTLSNNFNLINNIPFLKLIEYPAGNVTQVNLQPLLTEDEQPILELPEINLRNAPPLYAPLRGEISTAPATPLFSVISEGIETNFPAIAIMEQGNIRRSHVLPWGWFRMLQSPNELHRNYATSLITNINSWTASDPDNRKLRISPVKQSFSTSDIPALSGTLLNERSEPEEDATIEVTLRDNEEEEIRTFNMEHTGNGNYRLQLPRLAQGMYSYTATARKGLREIESQSGEFLISDTSMEFINTTRNDDILKSIANNSGGNYFTFENAAAIWDSLESSDILVAHTETIENYSFPVRNIYWFLIVLILLGTEWIVRKYYSLP